MAPITNHTLPAHGVLLTRGWVTRSTPIPIDSFPMRRVLIISGAILLLIIAVLGLIHGIIGCCASTFDVAEPNQNTERRSGGWVITRRGHAAAETRRIERARMRARRDSGVADERSPLLPPGPPIPTTPTAPVLTVVTAASTAAQAIQTATPTSPYPGSQTPQDAVAGSGGAFHTVPSSGDTDGADDEDIGFERDKEDSLAEQMSLETETSGQSTVLAITETTGERNDESDQYDTAPEQDSSNEASNTTDTLDAVDGAAVSENSASDSNESSHSSTKSELSDILEEQEACDSADEDGAPAQKQWFPWLRGGEALEPGLTHPATSRLSQPTNSPDEDDERQLDYYGGAYEQLIAKAGSWKGVVTEGQSINDYMSSSSEFTNDTSHLSLPSAMENMHLEDDSDGSADRDSDHAGSVSGSTGDHAEQPRDEDSDADVNASVAKPISPIALLIDSLELF